MTLALGLLALLALMAVIPVAFRGARAPLGGGLLGMIVGFLLGIIADVSIGVLHFFAGIDIPDPVVQIGGIATTLGTLYPILFGFVGLIAGCALRARNKNS